ncbi:MAG: FecR domain-containing protein [Myxococcales bacterium]
MRPLVPLVWLAWSFATTTSWAGDAATIVRGSATTRIEGGRDWSTVSSGQLVAVGVTLRTGSQPVELSLSDGVHIAIEPESEAKWMAPGRLPTETNGWAHGAHLELHAGALTAQVPSEPRGTHAFLVSTKAGTLTGWRGSVHVTVREEMTAVAIYEGALIVGSNGQGFAVFDGAGVVMRKGLNPDRARTVPAPPSWLSTNASMVLAMGDKPASLEFSWASVPNAASYGIEIGTEPTMVDRIVRATTQTTRHSLLDLSTGSGRHFARARCVDSMGIVGLWSVLRPLRVVRLTAPPGTVLAQDGAMVLPPGHSAKLVDNSGLQVAYESPEGNGADLEWVAAPTELRLGSGAHWVHLRDPAIGARTRVLMTPRQLRARVTILPKRARWPRDPLDVTVVVDDPSGRVDASREPITFESLLNIDPLPVAWVKQGTTWTARIAPRLLRAPSVVRIYVKDSYGIEIGGGFLEISE